LLVALVAIAASTATYVAVTALYPPETQETRVQNYLRHITELVGDAQPTDAQRAVLREETRAVLEELDSEHKVRIVRVLSEANLLQGGVPVSLAGANLRGFEANSADLSPTYDGVSTNLSGVDLRGADLSPADDSIRSDLSRTNLRGADLSGADLRGADLSSADLGPADMTAFYGRGAYLSGADLRGARLRDAYLRGADLRGADLRGADLRGAPLGDPYVSGADLSRIDLSGADLSGADLSGADLSGADLRGVYLSPTESDTPADFSEANLRGADLRGANEGIPTDLREAVGLTQEQIEEAIGDGTTELPEGLTRPATWTDQTDEQSGEGA